MTRFAPAPARGAALFAALLALAACEQPGGVGADPAGPGDGPGSVQLDPVTENNLSEVMLTLADSAASVDYFRRALGRDPTNVSLRQGYARALVRDRQNAEAVQVFDGLAADGAITSEGRVLLAASQARLNDWDKAEAALNALPAGFTSMREQQLRGMIADQRQDWPAADVHYEMARQMAPNPAPILNNIGVSLLARGDYPAAETAFRDALDHDATLFEAKNNLALSFALRRRYTLPVLALTEEERAILLHNVAMVALRQGDREVAINLLERSVETHPRHWGPAADKLAALKAAKG
ncbi:tetratricopeptide repeat protein [Rhodovulum sp. DZ06]|uniref:tetratricopeptide repeat protein n=1 Tax=Rhodovulum sp. DZ06 TaxID=3425126 RepID=UPI003D351BA1